MINALALDRVETSTPIEIPHPKDPNQTKTRHAAFKLSKGVVYEMDQPLFDRLVKQGLVEQVEEQGVAIEFLR